MYLVTMQMSIYLKFPRTRCPQSTSRSARPATSDHTASPRRAADRPRESRLSFVINKKNIFKTSNTLNSELEKEASNQYGIEKKMCILLTFGWVSSSGRKNVSLIFNYHIWQTLNRKFWKNGLLLLFLFHIFSLIIHIFKKYFDNFFGRGFDDFFVLAIHCGNAEIIDMTFYCSRYSSRYS